MNTNSFIPTVIKSIINIILSYQVTLQKDKLTLAKYKFKIS
jgi:hypothetical protein